MTNQAQESPPDPDSAQNAESTEAELDFLLDNLDAPREVRSLATEFVDVIDETMWAVDKRRATILASAVYIAGKAANENYTQSKVADHSGVSIGTISTSKVDSLNAYLDVRGKAAPPALRELDADSL